MMNMEYAKLGDSAYVFSLSCNPSRYEAMDVTRHDRIQHL